VPRIKEAEMKAAKVKIYFNNLVHKHKEIQLQDQFTLGEF
jgi:hypothetical protein